MNTTPIVSHPLRILHLEDNPHDKALIHARLHSEDLEISIRHVQSQREFLTALDLETFDLILADKCLPGFDGLVALNLVKEKKLTTPFIFVTGSIGEEAAIETIRTG